MGFRFDGISSGAMGIKTRMDTESRIPDLRNQTEKISGKHGIYDFGETFSERIIEITCFIPPGNTERELLTVKDNLAGWLNPDKGLCPLILDSEPDRVYYARISDGLVYERMVRTTGTFDLTFFCPDPFAYALEDEVFSLNQSGDITRIKGNCDSLPVLEVVGSLLDTSQQIRIGINDEVMKICGPLGVSDVLVVDTSDMTVILKQSGENALHNLSNFVFPPLRKGTNTITIGVTGGSFVELTVRARSRWL